MNERIKELAISKGIYDCICDPYDKFNTGDHYSSVIFDLERFAESIIKECIEQIQLSTARDPRDTPQYRQSVGHIHRIRQHFGIE